MNSFNQFRHTIGNITGSNARQQRLLGTISDWAETVQKFLMRYDLFGSLGLGTILDSPGDAKFDLVGITYNGRPLVHESKSLKTSGIHELIIDIVEQAENARRFLITPKFQQDKLEATLQDIRVKYENLQDELLMFNNE